MTKGIEFLEQVYEQLHVAGIVRSKGVFSKRLLGKSPSYLTSMRARQRVISVEVIMGLGDNLMAEIVGLGLDPPDAEMSATLRRAVALVNNYLADQIVPERAAFASPLTGQKTTRRAKELFGWLRALVTVSHTSSPRDISPHT